MENEQIAEKFGRFQKKKIGAFLIIIEKLLNPSASIGRTGTSNVFLLKSAGRRTGTSNEISVSKVSLYISRNVVSFFFLLWF